MPGRPTESPTPESAPDRLEGWKAIAAYLNRDVRTAKRWEVAEALPVHRHQHHARSSVYAYASELDRWRVNRRPDTTESTSWLAKQRRVLILAPAMTAALLMSGGGRVFEPVGVTAQGAPGSPSTASVSPRLVSGTGAVDRVSPDGKYGVLTTRDDIGVKDMQTGEVKWLQLHARADSAVFSPDASQIAFSLMPAQSLHVVANQVGAKPRLLLSNADFDYVVPGAWSPDGKSILVAVRRLDKTWQLAWVSATNGAMTVLRSLNWRYNEDGFDLSPDGRFIAYSAMPENPSQPNPPRTEAPDRYVYVIPANGVGEEAVVVKKAGDNVYPVWTLDSAHLLFESGGGSSRELQAIAVDDGKASGTARLIKRFLGQAEPIGITRAGIFLYRISSPNPGVDIVSLNADSSRPADSIPGATNAAWSPDGKLLAFRKFNFGSGTPLSDVVIRSLETGEERSFAIAPPRGAHVDAPLWFHDSSEVLASVWTPTTANPVGFQTTWQRLNLTTGVFGDLATLAPTESLYGGALSTDDRTFYTTRVRFSGAALAATIVAVDLTTGREREVVSLPQAPRTADEAHKPEFPRLFLSQDNRTLVYSRTTEASGTRVASINIDGSGARELFSAPAMDRAQLLGWSRDGRSVLIERSSELLRVPAEGGAAEQTGVKLPEVRNYGLLIADVPFLFLSPDGTRLALAKLGGTEELWAIDNIPALLSPANH